MHKARPLSLIPPKPIFSNHSILTGSEVFYSRRKRLFDMAELMPLQLDKYSFAKPVSQNFLHDERISPACLKLLMWLHALTGAKCTLLMNISTLAKFMNMSRRHIHNLLNMAEAAGYLFRCPVSVNRWTTKVRICVIKKNIEPLEKPEDRENQGVKCSSHNNGKYLFSGELSQKEREYLDRIEQIAARNNISIE